MLRVGFQVAPGGGEPGAPQLLPGGLVWRELGGR